MKFSLIICGYNEEENIAACIESCIAQEFDKREYEIIYVDNNSKDDSLKIAKSYPIKVFTEVKQGLSEARNCGIRNSVGDILVFLDADLKLDSQYLNFHCETFTREEVWAGGGKVLPLVETWVSNYLGCSLLEGYPRFKHSTFVKTYPGCNLTIRRSVLNQVGSFKEGLTTAKGITRFSEDKEMCERIRLSGGRIYYNSFPIVFHKNTFLMKDLFRIWIKGSKSRASMIKSGKSDIISSLFKFNIPIIYLLIVVLAIILDFKIAALLIILAATGLLSLCLYTYNKTRLFVQCLFIKPLMDVLSILVVNVSVVYYRFIL